MDDNLDDHARGATVLVTGATGYVAGWLVKRLVAAGAHVHAAVRNPSDETKIAHLKRMVEGMAGSIVFFAADLLEDGSFDAAMTGCSVVFHTASPFLSEARVKDPQKDLVDPALKGTITVLDSANRTPSVRRVVLTSSVAAMQGGPADIERNGGSVTETSWNTISSLSQGAYQYSKTLAEKKAWEIADAQDSWRLVVINPGLVLGEGTADTQTSASFDLVRNLADGTFAGGPPPIQLGMVDVRDVAEAHFRAGFLPEASGRHVTIERVHTVDELVEMIRAEAGDGWSYPTKPAIAPGTPRPVWDNEKTRRELGLTYRPVAPAVAGMVRQLIATGNLAHVTA